MDWFYYVDKNVTVGLLDEMCNEFLRVLDKCPAKVKKLIKSSSSVPGRLNNPARAVSQPGQQHKQPGECTRRILGTCQVCC